MRDLLICRICLATDIKLFNIHKYKLVESYEMLTQTKVSDCDRLPQHICSYCSTLLLKSAQFKRKCNKTQDLLKYSLTQQEMPAFEYLNTIDRIHQNLVLPYIMVTTNKVDITVGIRLDSKIKDEIADWSDKDEEPLVITKKLYNKRNNDDDNVDDFDMSVKMEDSLNEQSPIVQDNTGLFETNTQFDTKSKEYEILDSDSDTQVTILNKYEQFSDSVTYLINRQSKGSLVNIQRTHMVELPYVCTECPKRFKTPERLQSHLRTHTGERPFRCTDCPKAFTLPDSLRRHRLVHQQTGERPYRCTECPKAFSLAFSLKTHRRVHTGDKPYECEVCEKRFSQHKSCKLHYFTVHLKQPAPYERKSRVKKRKTDSNDETNMYEDVESGETNELEVIDEVGEVVMDESEGIDAVKQIEINKYEKDKKDQDQVTKYEIVNSKFEEDEYEDSKANKQRYLPKVKYEIKDEDVTIKEEDVDHNFMAEIATCTGPAKDSTVRKVFLDKDHLNQTNNESLMRKSVLVGENEVALDNRRTVAKRTYSRNSKKSKEVVLNSGNAMKSLKDDKLFSLNKLNSQQYNDVAVKIEKPEETGTVKAAQCNVALIKVEKKEQKKIILNETL